MEVLTFSMSTPQNTKLKDKGWEGANASFLEQLYEQHKNHDRSLARDWDEFFQEIQHQTPDLHPQEETAFSSPVVAHTQKDVADLIRKQGYLYASCDPLHRFRPHGPCPWTYRDLNDHEKSLVAFYTGSVAYEWWHPEISEEEAAWWSRIIEDTSQEKFSIKTQNEFANSLARATFFERTLQFKLPGYKRFGLDGCESLMVLLHRLRDHIHQKKIPHWVLGMPHRGRLNVLAHLLDKPYEDIMGEMKGLLPKDAHESWQGDVPYHLGASTEWGDGHPLNITLLSNPSHLESVNPVVMGLVRAHQDSHPSKPPHHHAVGCAIHGDASFAGQGIVYETLQMGGIPAYNIHGLIHIIINNRIGFTANPEACHRGRFPTSAARGMGFPVIHVNADDVEAVARVTDIAWQYQQTFNKGLVIDLIGYRRYGHNENDEPSLTQHSLYQTIKDHPNTWDLYKKTIQRDDVSDDLEKTIRQELQNVFEKSLKNKHTPMVKQKVSPHWGTTMEEWPRLGFIETGLERKTLKACGEKACEWPKDFKIHTKIETQYEQRRRRVQGYELMDWSTAEMLALATLLHEGHRIRFLGQDTERGTFSQRHAVLHDTQTDNTYTPLSALGSMTIANSLLSEYAALGYEWGYSLHHPQTLTMWEAQFGDFANGAQVIIDQYIASAQTKWGALSGLVLLLPHGFEGQGSEHSSARLERFLQLSADHNWMVVNCTTPSNYFHALRRQMAMPTRRPLIMMTPKSLLRHKKALSRIEDFTSRTGFESVIVDHDPQDKDLIQQVVLCSGKIYYELFAEREAKKRTDTLLVRCEQLYPFPMGEICSLVDQYPKCHWLWCQEEPQNMGAWDFVVKCWSQLPLETPPSLQYIGRFPSSTPATGFKSQHEQEQQDILDAIFEFEDSIPQDLKDEI